MIRLNGSNGGGRQKHQGKSQFVFYLFFPALPLSQTVSVWAEGAGLQLGHSLGWLCLSCSGLFSQKGAALLPSCPCSLRASPRPWSSQPFSGKALWAGWCQVTYLFTELAKGLAPDLGYTPSSLLGLYPYIPYKPQGLLLFLIF